MEFATPTVEGKNNKFSVSHGDDSGLLVEFYNHPTRLGAESEKAGREVYKDVPYIRIRFPGDRNRMTERKVQDKDKSRFPIQWAAFENQEKVVEEGTPIDEWPPASRSFAMMCKSINIFTVENLAAVSDSSLENLGTGGRTFRDKARSWLEEAADGAEAMKLHKENEDLREDLAAKDIQIADLAARIEELEKGS